MNFREYATSGDALAYDPYRGTLTIDLAGRGRYIYQTPYGSHMGEVPPAIRNWQRAVKAHPSNLYKVVLRSLNKLVETPGSNWSILVRPTPGGPVS